MPLYEYKCEHCSEEFEEIASSSDQTKTKCPKCGRTAKKKLSCFAIGGAKSGGSSGSRPTPRCGSTGG